MLHADDDYHNPSYPHQANDDYNFNHNHNDTKENITLLLTNNDTTNAY